MTMSMTGAGGFRNATGNPKSIAGHRVASLSTQNPLQQDLMSLLYGGSRGGLQSTLQNLSGMAAGDQSQFEQLEAPALRQFGALQGQIASRFSGGGGPGAMSARRSGAFGLAQNSAAMDFAERLQGQRLGYQQQAQSQLMQLAQSLLGQQTQENFLIPKEKPMWQQLLLGLTGAAGQGLGTMGGIYGARKLGF